MILPFSWTYRELKIQMKLWGKCPSAKKEFKWKRMEKAGIGKGITSENREHGMRGRYRLANMGDLKEQLLRTKETKRKSYKSGSIFLA